jgi:hypothetical protein
VFVGRITRAGTVQLYFYSAREFPKHVLLALEEQAPRQDFEVEVRPDPKWSEYIETLHPGPAHLPLLVSWVLLDVRARENDDVAREREVDQPSCSHARTTLSPSSPPSWTRAAECDVSSCTKESSAWGWR